MRILIDECLDWRLSRALTGHDFISVQKMGWGGIKNGKLLALAQEEFDVFLTVDRNLSFQQNTTKFQIAIVVLVAGSNHLVRELAMELAPLVRVNGVAPATVVQGSAMFPGDRVVASLAKYNIAYTDDEVTESLMKKLSQFYADRTLTKAPITPADQAEAYFLLVSQRLSKTPAGLSLWMEACTRPS